MFLLAVRPLMLSIDGADCGCAELAMSGKFADDAASLLCRLDEWPVFVCGLSGAVGTTGAAQSTQLCKENCGKSQ